MQIGAIRFCRAILNTNATRTTRVAGINRSTSSRHKTEWKMQELQQAVSNAFANVVAAGTIEKAIEEKLTSTITSIINEELRSYSDFGKALSEQVKAAMQVDFSNLELPGYNDLILKLIRAQVEHQASTSIAAQVEAQMKELLAPAPAEIKLSELVEEFITFTSKADTTVVTSHLLKLRNNQFGQDAREPMPTLTAGGGHVGEVRTFLEKYHGADALGLVTIRGETYAIVDIGMRMLTPRELARAQGFPDSYVLDPVFNGKPLSKSAQVRMIGNSVCPDVATALIVANFAHEKQMTGVAA
jgi:site-specific DNA-cytosine methylase